jgi:peptide deformylase
MKTETRKTYPPLSLRLHPDPVLRQTCMPVEKFDTWLSDVIHEMFTLMQMHKGIGLAAPQVGLTGRFFVAEINKRFLCLINPMIINATGNSHMTEGCLSLPELSVSIERNSCIDVVGYNILGHRQHHRLDGLWARAVQHELDHLNGMLICDYNTANHEVSS